MITAIIIDDELGACENLNIIISEMSDNILVKGFAHNTSDGEALINRIKPGIVFLDIEMPHENGITFLNRIDNSKFETIFVTAYDEYAIKAFKLNAIDYVLKPIDKHYLEKAIRRAEEFVHYKIQTTADAVVKSEEINLALEDSIKLRVGKDFVNLDFDETILLYSTTGYSIFQVVSSTKEYSSSYSLGHYEEILPDYFIRVHRSYIINSLQIKDLRSEDGQHTLVMNNGAEIPISRRRLKTLKPLLK